MTEQTIWLGPRATAFTAVCEACAEQRLGVENWLASTVTGTLRLDADRASISCTRGHVLRIARESRVRPGAF